MDAHSVRQKHREFLFPCVTNYYETPIVLTSGRGACVSDMEGREYIDFFGGILTVSLGHCQPDVVGAIREQIGTLGHTSTLYPTENLVDLAETVARLTPGRLKKSFFTNSGTEANETALLLARLSTGSREIIALRHGYSGRSMVAMDLTGLGQYRLIAGQIPGIVHAHAPYCYRCPFKMEYPACDLHCARDVEELIRTQTSGRPAAFLAEAILGLGGFITPPPEYFQIAVGIVRNHGGVFVCDEVQTGFGRTGTAWFGIEHYGVEPDIMTMAKGAANGMPICITTARAELADSLRGATISTFGGNPVSLAAARATVGVMEREDVPARAERLGARLREFLSAMKDTYPFIGDVRGMGLMQAVELVEDRASKEPSPQKAGEVMEATRREGLLIGRGGLYGNTLRLAPPMLISETELDEACARLHRAFAAL